MKHVLVPIDGSIASAGALTRGIDLARASSARLSICAVVDPHALTGHITPHVTDRSMIDAAKTDAERLVRDAVAQAVEAGVSAEGSVVVGDASEEIVRCAHAFPVDVIVMGTHGRTGFRRLHTGSVARAVLRNAACEVITVREPAGSRAEMVPPQPAHYESAVFMVRLLEVKPENFDRLYGDMTSFLQQSCREIAGIVSTQIFGSDDNTRVLMIVEFRSYEDWVHAQWDPRLASSVEEVALLSETLDFELYRGARFIAPATTVTKGVVARDAS